MESQVTQGTVKGVSQPYTLLEYEGNPVSFLLDASQVWVNATQMARLFGKMPNDYARSDRTMELISAISDGMGIPVAPEFKENRHLVRVVNGNGGGTWLHRELALDFARWLSPKFAIWCDRKIQELLQTGKTQLPEIPVITEWVAMSPEDQAIAFFTERKKHLALQAKQQEDAPRVALAMRIESSPSTCSVDECAKEIKAPIKMFREWVQSKYLFRRHGEWWAREEYGPNGQGLFSMRTGSWTARNGEEIISHTVKVTGKGRTVLANGWAKYLQGIENTLKHMDNIGAQA